MFYRFSHKSSLLLVVVFCAAASAAEEIPILLGYSFRNGWWMSFWIIKFRGGAQSRPAAEDKWRRRMWGTLDLIPHLKHRQESSVAESLQLGPSISMNWTRCWMSSVSMRLQNLSRLSCCCCCSCCALIQLMYPSDRLIKITKRMLPIHPKFHLSCGGMCWPIFFLFSCYFCCCSSLLALRCVLLAGG